MKDNQHQPKEDGNEEQRPSRQQSSTTVFQEQQRRLWRNRRRYSQNMLPTNIVPQLPVDYDLSARSRGEGYNASSSPPRDEMPRSIPPTSFQRAPPPEAVQYFGGGINEVVTRNQLVQIISHVLATATFEEEDDEADFVNLDD